MNNIYFFCSGVVCVKVNRVRKKLLCFMILFPYYNLLLSWIFITFANEFKSLNMEHKDLNRLKVVLVEKKKTSKWLAEQLGKNPSTVSKWCTNSAQPDLQTLDKIAELLQCDTRALITSHLETERYDQYSQA